MQLFDYFNAKQYNLKTEINEEILMVFNLYSLLTPVCGQNHY